MKLVKIREGTTDLMVPKDAIAHFKGPASSKTAVFFNPVMEFSRDVSVLMLREFLKNRKTRLLDGLAGTGARGVRIGNECKGDFDIIVNDHNPVAFRLIKKNITLNQLNNCTPMKKKLNPLLGEEDFDYVDIDPFGSPVQFLDATVQSLRGKGMLAVTATDCAPLCGTYSKTCIRRYGARSARTLYSHETAARILAGHCIKLGAKYDITLKPLLTFFVDHYIRIHFGVQKGAKKTDRILKNVGFLIHNRRTGDRKAVLALPDVTDEIQYSGPLWIGDLHEKAYLKRIKPDDEMVSSKRIEKLLSLWIEEADAPPFFYDVNEIAKITKTQPLPISTIINTLSENGYFASRTHFSPTGFKTDAKIGEIRELVCGG